MKDLNREREVLAQLYTNTADSTKYLPFFFNNFKQLEMFFDMFAGKTLKIPTSYREFLENYLKTDGYISNEKQKGINVSNGMRKKILESYLNLFSTLEEAIETECKRE